MTTWNLPVCDVEAKVCLGEVTVWTLSIFDVEAKEVLGM